jgi:ABC-type glycerol-3-phosphate transport system permease component
MTARTTPKEAGLDQPQPGQPGPAAGGLPQAAPRPGIPWRRRLRRQVPALLLYAVTIAFLIPFFWVLAHSFETPAEFERGHPTLWPAHPTLSNYKTVLVADGFWRPILNSLIVASLTTAITLVFGSLAGYALSRLPIRGRPLVLGLVTLAGFFPMMAMIGPLFNVMTRARLLNTLPGLSLSDLIYTLPLTTWLLAALFGQLPRELEEAAMVDGCGRLTALRRIVIPVAAPAIFTAGIFSFILAWSDFAFSLSFLESPGHFTAPLAIVTLGEGKYQIFYNFIDVALLVTALPIVVLVLLAQRRIVSGLTTGAIR